MRVQKLNYYVKPHVISDMRGSTNLRLYDLYRDNSRWL